MAYKHSQYLFTKRVQHELKTVTRILPMLGKPFRNRGEVGRMLGMTRNGVRYIELMALAKIISQLRSGDEACD